MNAAPLIPPPEPYRHVGSADSHEFGFVGPIAMCLALDPPQWSVMDELATQFLAAAGGESRAMLVVIPEDAPPPKDPVRDAVLHFFKRIRPRMLGAGLIVEGSGFAAAAKRGFLSFISLTERFDFPYVIVGSCREAIRKLESKRLRLDVSFSELDAALEHLRSRSRLRLVD